MATLRRNSGLHTLRDLAVKVCRAYALFAPYLKLYFSNRPSLIAALDGVNAACGVMITEIDQARADEFPP